MQLVQEQEDEGEGAGGQTAEGLRYTCLTSTEDGEISVGNAGLDVFEFVHQFICVTTVIIWAEISILFLEPTFYRTFCFRLVIGH